MTRLRLPETGRNREVPIVYIQITHSSYTAGRKRVKQRRRE